MKKQASHATPSQSAYVVLDIETAPDPHPVVRIPSGSAVRSSMSHLITAAAMLVARRQEGLSWTVDAIRSWHGAEHDEYAVLRGLQGALLPLLDTGATLVTFNGVRHDVPTIRRRAAFHRMFGSRTWPLLATAPHRDLMTDGLAGREAQWVSLAQSCIGLSIPWEHAFQTAAQATPGVAQRKCETDVCAEFVLLLYTLAMEHGHEFDLTHGWRALASHVARDHAGRPHLMQFAHAAEDQCI